MGSFGGGLESLAIEFDPRSILAAVAVANKNIESLEGTTEKTAKGMQRDWEGVATLLTKVGDRSKNAADSYIRSLERQAAAVGKSGIDKLNAQMEQAIKNYGYSEAAIKKITSAYEKMAEAQEKGAKGFGAGTRAGMGARDLFEGRNAYAAVEFGKGLTELQGAPAILGAVASGFVAAAAAGFELVKSAGEGARELNNLAIRTGLTVEQAENLSIQAKIAGVDINSLERSAVQLSKGLEDASGAGKKQAEALRDIGVSTLQSSGQQREMGEVLSDVLQKLSQIPDTSKRLYEAQLLLGRGAKELQPMISDLGTLKETADQLSQSLASGANEELLKAARKISEIDVAWDVFKKNLAARIAPIIIPVLYSFTRDSGPGPRGLASDSAQQHPLNLLESQPSTSWLDQLNPFGSGSTEPIARSFAPSRSQTATFAESFARDFRQQAGQGEATRQRILREQGVTQEGLESTLTNLKEQIAKDRATLNQTGANSEAYLDAQKDLKKVLEQQLATENSLKALRAEPNYANALEGFSLKADQGLVKQLEDNRHAADELRKQYPGHAQAIGQQEYLNIDAILKEFTDKATIAFQKAAEKGAEEQVKMAEERSSIENSINQQNMKSLAEAAKSGMISTGVPGEGITIPLTPGMGTPPGPSSRQQSELTKDMLAQESKRIELMAGPGGELAAARQILELKKQALSIDEGQAELEAQAITNQTEREKKIFDIRLEYSRQIYDAEAQYQDKLLERQKQVAETAAGLYHTLFTNPKKFAPQLENTLKEAALKPVTEGLGNLTAKAIFAGSGGIKDVRSTNGAMHVFVTNIGGGLNSSEVSSTVSIPFFTGSGAPSTSSAIPIPFFGGAGMSGGGTASLPYFGASAPLFAGGTAGSTSLPSLFASNPASSIGPGGTSGFAGPVGISASHGTNAFGINPGGLLKIGGNGPGFNLGTLFGRGPNPGPSASDQPGWTGTAAPPPGGYDPGVDPSASGASTMSTIGGSLANMGASAGIGFGSKIAMHGLTGRDEGTAAGVGWDTLGGAMTGAGIGEEIMPGMGAAIGAGIGAAAGALAGIGEMLAGVMSPQAKASMYAKQMYGITINDNMQNQIVNIANQSYAGNIQLAVRSPQVRQMLGLYAAGTGQANAKALMDSTPHAAGLSQQGGVTYQDPSTLYGQSYKYSSSLPTLGGNNTTQTYNSPSGYSGSQPPVVIQNLTLPVGEKSVAAFLTGQVVTPDYIADGYSQSLMNSNNRVSNSATLQEPGLITA